MSGCRERSGERLATILRDHVKCMEKDYPLIDVSDLRSGGFINQKWAKLKVKAITRVVRKGKEEVQKQQGKANKRSKREL